jgi:arylsulfatase A-like enzyme
MMGYKTPNIDRIAKEGALFTDWYGQQSCTAGRSAFITGQSGFRTGCEGGPAVAAERPRRAHSLGHPYIFHLEGDANLSRARSPSTARR